MPQSTKHISARNMIDKPRDAAVLEQAFSLVNEVMFAVALQRRRVRSQEPEDSTFPARYWIDLQFFIVALRRLRRAAELAGRVPAAKDSMIAALKEFDRAIPDLSIMRNVGEHIDDYALDSNKHRHKNITRRMLQVGAWDGTTYEWLSVTLNVDVAHDAAFTLQQAVKKSLKDFPDSLAPSDARKHEA